jgi:CO/xanthine dehydrogenase Mo-binding subunit
MKNDTTKNPVSLQNTETDGIPRRNFIKLLGGGIVICFMPMCAGDGSSVSEIKRRSLPKDYNAFLRIAEDGTVSCFTGKIEMGQGAITALVQVMADELNVPMEKVKMVMGDTDLCPWDGGTWGSTSIRQFGPKMRVAAAEARGVLLELASENLGVPVSQLVVKDGIITDSKNPDKSVSYSQLTKGKKIEKFLDILPSVEDHTKFTYVGKSFLHADAVEKVTGKAIYTGDLKLPGMVFARILRPPSYGAKLTSVDYSDAEKLEGVDVVRDGDLIAVLHKNIERADEALSKIKAEYSYDELPVNHKTIFERMLKSDTKANIAVSDGDLEAGKSISEKTFESEFHDPFIAHVPIEPHTALAEFVDGKMTIWASSQTPFPLQDQVSAALGLPLEKVRVIIPFVGGGFGGKGINPQGVEVARIAKLSGKPVMLAYTRDEEFFMDRLHTAGVIKVKSGIDKSGMIKMWDYHIYYSGMRGAEVIYNVPNVKVANYSLNENATPVHPYPTGPWRAPNANTNTFARESQIDIMANAAGIDPLEFRLKNLKDQRMIDCLEAVAEKFGYVAGKTPSGRGIGIATGIDVGTYVAQIAEVEVNKKTGEVKVIRVACSQDMGMCVNPQGATIQIEGCITMALGYTLTEELLFEGGNMLSRGFDTYDIPRFSWIPKIDSVILDRMDQPPHGGGEPAIVPVGAAVANAIFDATGARMYRMPMTPERVLEAIKRV